VLISVWNMIFPMVITYMVKERESHHTLDDMEDSFISKTVAARGFTSTLILYAIGLSYPTQILGPYYMGSLQSVLLSDAIISPLTRFLDLGSALNRFLAQYARSDPKAKAMMIGTDYLLAERCVLREEQGDGRAPAPTHPYPGGPKNGN
jgi:hypothetical protein